MGLEQLRNFRARLGLTQQGAGKLFGVTRETWALWESGHRRIGRTKLKVVSQKTKIPRRELRPDLAELLTDEAGQ